MMSKSLPGKLISGCKRIAKIKSNIWDIVVYGSFARGKRDAGDIDIAVILKKHESANNKLAVAQEMRKVLSVLVPTKKMDIKIVELNDLLSVSFLAREGIIAEGFSLVHKNYLCERFGFTPTVIINYSLKNLTQSKQKMFYYALNGRKGEGILQKMGGKIMAKGMMQVPLRHYEEIKELAELHKVTFKPLFALSY